MGIPVLIMGESGSGKSASMRNFNSDEVGIFNIACKSLPFKKKMENKIDGASYDRIVKSLVRQNMKRYIIDDSQYLMAFAMFDRAGEVGYQKFTDIAKSFYDLVQYVIRSTQPDCIVYFLHHTEMTESGRVKAKTSGKMLDNQLTLEGLFSIVLLCVTDGSRHYFVTQSDGFTTAKSPMDMFDREIDNDLRLVDNQIRKYYELGGILDESAK